MRALVITRGLTAPDTLIEVLRAAWVSVDVADTVGDGHEKAGFTRYSTVILSQTELGWDGERIMAELRLLHPLTRIMVVADSSDPELLVETLNDGADDYQIWPVPAPELAARVLTLGRRSLPPPASSPPLRVGDLWIDPPRHLAGRGEHNLELPLREFKLLARMMAGAGIPVERRALVRAVWGDNAAVGPTHLRSLVRSLRQQVGTPTPIATVAKVGYRIDTTASVASSIPSPRTPTATRFRYVNRPAA